MKTNYTSFFTKSTFLVSTLFLGLTACQKQNEDVMPQTSDVTETALVETVPEEIMATDAVGATSATASVSYTVSPATKVWTTCSSGDIKNTSCGVTFKAGLRAYVKSVSGNKVTVQIQRCDGKPFGAGGTGYIKPTNPCGGTNNSIAGNTSWTSTAYNYIDVDFWATFTSGAVAFYPTITLTNGTRMYANPITVTAKDNVVPPLNTQLVASKQGGLAAGTVYGYVNSVAVYSNGPTEYLTSRGSNYSNGKYTGEKWQCVEFMRRFYLEAYGYHISETKTSAKLFYNNVSNLKSYTNGGSVAPQPGDILCMSSSSNGHVAIITEVGRSYIKIAHQNVGGLTHIGLSLSRNGNSISASAISSSLTVQGWMRR